MVIYEHFLWNFAIFYPKPWAWKVGLGGVLPDLLYVFGFLWRIFSYESFREWMVDPLWATLWNSPIAKASHSLVFWVGISTILILVLMRPTFKGIAPVLLGWGLHILFDGLTHVSDGYALFYPLSNYRLPALVSYWESQYHGKAYFWVSHTGMAFFVILWVFSRLKPFLTRSPGSDREFATPPGPPFPWQRLRNQGKRRKWTTQPPSETSP